MIINYDLPHPLTNGGVSWITRSVICNLYSEQLSRTTDSTVIVRVYVPEVEVTPGKKVRKIPQDFKDGFTVILKSFLPPEWNGMILFYLSDLPS